MEKSKRDEIKKRIKKCCSGYAMKDAVDNLIRYDLALTPQGAIHIYDYYKENQK